MRDCDYILCNDLADKQTQSLDFLFHPLPFKNRFQTFALDTLLESSTLATAGLQKWISAYGSKYVKIVTDIDLRLPQMDVILFYDLYGLNSPRLLGCWSNPESFGLQIHTQRAWVALHRGPRGMVGMGGWLDELTIHIILRYKAIAPK